MGNEFHKKGGNVMKRWIPIILIGISIIISIVTYPYLPDQVPTHWNIHGEVDDYSSKLFQALLLPGMLIFIYLIFILPKKIDPKKENFKKFGSSYYIIMIATMLLFNIIQVITTLVALGYSIDMPMVIRIVVGVLLVVIGNYLPRARQNFFMGVRTPWTLSSEKVWDRTHRLSSKVFVIVGIIMTLSVFLPTVIQAYFVIAMIVILAIVPIVSSYIFYRQENK